MPRLPTRDYCRYDWRSDWSSDCAGSRFSSGFHLNKEKDYW